MAAGQVRMPGARGNADEGVPPSRRGAGGAADDVLLLSMLELEGGAGVAVPKTERRSRRAAADPGSDVTGTTAAGAWNALDDQRREELVRQAREEYASIKKAAPLSKDVGAPTESPQRSSRIQKERLSARTERSRREAAAARTEASRQIASVTGSGSEASQTTPPSVHLIPPVRPERKAPEAAVAVATRAAQELHKKVLAVEAAAFVIESLPSQRPSDGAPHPAASSAPATPDEQWPPPPVTYVPAKPVEYPKLVPLAGAPPADSSAAAINLAPDGEEQRHAEGGEARDSGSRSSAAAAKGKARANEREHGGEAASSSSSSAAEAGSRRLKAPAADAAGSPAAAAGEPSPEAGGGPVAGGYIAYKGRAYGPRPVPLASQTLSETAGDAPSAASTTKRAAAASSSSSSSSQPQPQRAAASSSSSSAQRQAPERRSSGGEAALDGGASGDSVRHSIDSNAASRRSAEGASTSGKPPTEQPAPRMRGGGGAPPGFFLPRKLVGPPGWETREIPNQKLPIAIQRVRELLEVADRDNGSRHSTKLSEEQLVRFIRTSSTPSSDQSQASFDVDTAEAAAAATRFSVFAAENPSLCDRLDGAEFEEFFSSGAVRVVRQPDNKGRKVIAIALAKIPAAADGLRLSRCLLYIIDRLGRDVQFQVFGVIFLFHCAELSHLDAIQLLSRIPISIFTQFFYAWHNCLPMRWQRTYVFEEPSAVPGVWSVIGSCLTETQRAKVRFHGKDYSALHAVISREYLPPEYLGTCPETPIEWLNEQRVLDEQSKQDKHVDDGVLQE